jgi:hypothetical protein
MLLLLFLFPLLAACPRPGVLTEAKAESVVRPMFRVEPVYAEVPQRVWYGPGSPQDDYDALAVKTLKNLERGGYLTVNYEKRPDGIEAYTAKVTQKGFRLLGTMPSLRGPVYRAKIAEKRYDGFRNFVRHPNDPTVGRGEIVWHYENPTLFYELFETKIDKPLNTPFASIVSFYWKNYHWNVSVIVKKEKG